MASEIEQGALADGVADALGVDEAMREVGLSVFGPPGLGAPNEHTPTIAGARLSKQYPLYDYGTTFRSAKPCSFRINRLRACDPWNIAQIYKIVGNLVKHGLAVDVARGTAQHDSPGGSFRRVGSAKRPMSGDERMRLAQQRGQARFVWFDRQVVPGTGFGTLYDELWKPLVSAAGAVNPETALEKQALLAQDDAETMRATVAGVLLCTRNPEHWLPCACITATRYRGTDRASGQVDAQEITGPLDRQVADAVAFAVRNMQVSARKTPARVNQPQYSDKALFEALVNAVAHRDYAVRGSRIRLSMFADRLEIQSPGALPNSLTVDSMADRQATRNEALTSALGRLPVDGIPGSEERRYFMERRGDGVPLIKRETYGPVRDAAGVSSDRGR